MVKELSLRHNELPNKQLNSIYIGGGTPSLLTITELNALFEQTGRYFSWNKTTEITLEANPDDLSKDYLHKLYKYTPVNRLSIGVQSFSDEDLQYMGRIHHAKQAEYAIRQAQDTGFENLSIDLIFGSPTTSDKQWATHLEKAAKLQIPHLSCYALTIEKKTALNHWIDKGQQPRPPEEKSARQFEQLMTFAERHGYEHYEISNIALPGYRAVHNSLYWQGTPYLGIGPSAHSYNGQNRRRWNIANNGLYLQRMLQGQKTWNEECLSTLQRYNELVLTRLRTSDGLSPNQIRNIDKRLLNDFERQAQTLIKNGLLLYQKNRYRLTRRGRLLADWVAAELFQI